MIRRADEDLHLRRQDGKQTLSPSLIQLREHIIQQQYRIFLDLFFYHHAQRRLHRKQQRAFLSLARKAVHILSVYGECDIVLMHADIRLTAQQIPLTAFLVFLQEHLTVIQMIAVQTSMIRKADLCVILSQAAVKTGLHSAKSSCRNV